jgi:hypothetical protein
VTQAEGAAMTEPLSKTSARAFDALDPASRARIEALFAGPLSDVGLVDIGQDHASEGFFTRKLHLITDPSGPTFRPVEHSTAAA